MILGFHALRMPYFDITRIFKNINIIPMLKPALDKKLIQIFVSFVEKALVPQIKKYDGSLT